MSSTIGFLHVTPVVAAMFPTELAITDESLLANARATSPEAVAPEIAARLDELRSQGVTLICCTCSTIGGVAESLGDDVIRVDRPMARAAARYQHVGLVGTHESTIEPSTALLREYNPDVQVTPAIGDDPVSAAWTLCEGDAPSDIDVLILAQASIAPAASQLDGLGVPVLASPPIMLDYLSKQHGAEL